MIPEGTITLTGDNPRNFEIALRIAHPSVDPADITKELALKPTGTQTVGQSRKTPKGALLDGFYPETVWRHSVRFTIDNQWFSDALKTFIHDLAQHKAFFAQLKSSGGEISISLILLGDGYFGDELAPELLMTLTDLGVSFGIESYTIPES